MTTIADAVGKLGYDDDDTSDICIARFHNGKCLHTTLSQSGHRPMSDFQDLFIAPAAFRKGSIQQSSGRTKANLTRIYDLVLDFDLPDFLEVEREWLYQQDAASLDGYVMSLLDEAEKIVTDYCRIPVTAWVETGYGVQAWCRLIAQDQTRLPEADALYKALVTAVNDLWKGERPLCDTQVNDAGSRLVRLPGCVNTKGTIERPCRIIGQARDEWLAIDDWKIESPPALPPQQIIPKHGKRLSDEDAKAIVLAINGEYREGRRHAIALGVAGMLGKAGIPREQAHSIIASIAESDPEPRDRSRAVDTTYDAIESGRTVAGWTRLRTMIAAPVLEYVDRKLEPFRPIARVIDVDISDVRERGEKRPKRKGFPMIPEEAFYGWFAEYRDVMRPTTEACAAYHLGVALTYAGAMLGRTVHTTLAVPIFPNLYVTLVGETGKSRKDTAMSRGKWFFSNEHSMGDLYISPFATLTDVVSAEGIVDVLDENPTMILYLTELSMLLRRARRQTTATLMPAIIKLWDAPWRFDLPRAIGHKGAKYVDLPFLSVLAATTPGTLASDMAGEDIESGFANRVLWFFGVGGEPITDPPKPDAALCRRLFADLGDALGQYRPGTELLKDAPAKAVWDAWYLKDYHREYPSEDDARLAQRKGANALKVATLYAASEASPVLREGHLTAAIALVEWSFDTTREQARTWGWGEGAKLGYEIVEAIRCSDVALTKTQISEAIGIRHDPYLVARTLKSLEDMGRVVQPQYGRYELP